MDCNLIEDIKGQLTSCSSNWNWMACLCATTTRANKHAHYNFFFGMGTTENLLKEENKLHSFSKHKGIKKKWAFLYPRYKFTNSFSMLC